MRPSQHAQSSGQSDASNRVTDLAVRVLPLGEDRAARIESRERVTRLLASLCPEL